MGDMDACSECNHVKIKHPETDDWEHPYKCNMRGCGCIKFFGHNIWSGEQKDYETERSEKGRFLNVGMVINSFEVDCAGCGRTILEGEDVSGNFSNRFCSNCSLNRHEGQVTAIQYWKEHSR